MRKKYIRNISISYQYFTDTLISENIPLSSDSKTKRIVVCVFPTGVLWFYGWPVWCWSVLSWTEAHFCGYAADFSWWYLAYRMRLCRPPHHSKCSLKMTRYPFVGGAHSGSFSFQVSCQIFLFITETLSKLFASFLCLSVVSLVALKTPASTLTSHLDSRAYSHRIQVHHWLPPLYKYKMCWSKTVWQHIRVLSRVTILKCMSNLFCRSAVDLFSHFSYSRTSQMSVFLGPDSTHRYHRSSRGVAWWPVIRQSRSSPSANGKVF